MPTFTLPFRRSAIAIAMISSLAATISACGGSGGSDGEDVDTTVVSGSVFASPVAGASCVAKDTSGEALSDVVLSSSDGVYSLKIATDQLDADVIIECNGGVFIDEADGSSQTAGTLSAYVGGGALSNNPAVHITPDSTVVRQLVTHHGMSLVEAATAFEDAFGYAPDTRIAPSDATEVDAGASDDEKLAGLRAATFSQLTMDLGLTPSQQFDLIGALADDLADGVLNGANGDSAITIAGTTVSIPVDIQNRFNRAMLNFREGGNDETGLGNHKIGNLPFAKTVLTDSYKVEYIPGAMAAMQGKTEFKVRLTNLSDGTPKTAAAVTLMPMMHMEAMNHATPVDGCSESNTPGTYDCTLYYLMASQMMGGSSMGYWDLNVMIGGMMGESAHFYPTVTMAMGDVRATLKNANDDIAAMMGTEDRTYYLFKSNLSGMGNNRTFQLFIAAKESMTSYPAVYESVTLDSGREMMADLDVTSMSVEMSTDGSTWIAADGSSNDGYWTATGISGLTDSTEGDIYVRMSINGVQYTTNGQTPAGDGSNDYATFAVTPGMSM